MSDTFEKCGTAGCRFPASTRGYCQKHQNMAPTATTTTTTDENTTRPPTKSVLQAAAMFSAQAQAASPTLPSYKSFTTPGAYRLTHQNSLSKLNNPSSATTPRTLGTPTNTSTPPFNKSPPSPAVAAKALAAAQSSPSPSPSPFATPNSSPPASPKAQPPPILFQNVEKERVLPPPLPLSVASSSAPTSTSILSNLQRRMSNGNGMPSQSGPKHSSIPDESSHFTPRDRPASPIQRSFNTNAQFNSTNSNSSTGSISSTSSTGSSDELNIIRNNKNGLTLPPRNNRTSPSPIPIIPAATNTYHINSTSPAISSLQQSSPPLSPRSREQFTDDLFSLNSHTTIPIRPPATLVNGRFFSQKLSHVADHVALQVEAGIYAAKRMKSVLKQYAALEDEFARGIFKLLEHEELKQEKVARDHMSIVQKQWSTTKEVLSALAQHHANKASSIMLDCVVPMKEYCTSATVRLKEIQAEERSMTQDMGVARAQVTKLQNTCYRMIQNSNLKNSKRHSMLPPSSQPPPDKAKSLLSKLNTKIQTMTAANPQHAKEKIFAACKQYQHAIEICNNKMNQYWTYDMTKVMNDYEQLEQTRCDGMKYRLAKFGHIQQQSLDPVSKLYAKLMAIPEAMDTTRDLSTFVDYTIRHHGPGGAPLPLTYALPLTPEEIQAGRTEGNPNSIFKVSLEQCMSLQAQSHPQLTIPRILVHLLRIIHDKGGYQTEGIFRISIGKDELDRLQTEFDRPGSYDNIQMSSANAAAALLKSWLLALEEPLITNAIYDKCIDCAKKDGSSSDVLALFNQLEPLHQRVITAIAETAAHISSPQNLIHTKMTIDNLAVVFAPSFFRTPSEDPMTILQNSKFECKFTAVLLRALIEQKGKT